MITNKELDMIVEQSVKLKVEIIVLANDEKNGYTIQVVGKYSRQHRLTTLSSVLNVITSVYLQNI